MLPLLIWLSPAFPVGAYAYSHGLEWAVEAGDVVDAASLEVWLVDLLAFGAPRSDAILFVAAFRAAARFCRKLFVARRTAAAGLFNSWARPAEILPRATSFSRCCSNMVVSRTRSANTLTSRWLSSGMRCSISVKWSLCSAAPRPSVTARAVDG